MSQCRFAVEGVRIRFHVAHTFYNPDRCIPATRSTIGTGERKRPQIDRSGRKRFIRSLFDLVANGVAVTVEHYGVGDRARNSELPHLWRDEQYRYVSATAEGPRIHLSTPRSEEHTSE